MHLVPLSATLCSVLLGFPLTFTQDLDACGVGQSMQSVAAWAIAHPNIQFFAGDTPCFSQAPTKVDLPNAATIEPGPRPDAKAN